MLKYVSVRKLVLRNVLIMLSFCVLYLFVVVNLGAFYCCWLFIETVELVVAAGLFDFVSAFRVFRCCLFLLSMFDLNRLFYCGFSDEKLLQNCTLLAVTYITANHKKDLMLLYDV